MKSSRFTETQIVLILNDADGGMLVKDLCRKHGIAEVGLLQAPEGLAVRDAEIIGALSRRVDGYPNRGGYRGSAGELFGFGRHPPQKNPLHLPGALTSMRAESRIPRLNDSIQVGVCFTAFPASVC